MKKIKRNWLLTGLLAMLMMFGLCLGFGLGGNQVQTVHATGGEPNPKATVDQVHINSIWVSDLNQVNGLTFDDGVLTIDSSFTDSVGGDYDRPAIIYVDTGVTADLTVVVNKHPFYAVIANCNGNLTIDGVGLQLCEAYAGQNLTIKASIVSIFTYQYSSLIAAGSPYVSARDSVIYAGEKISIEGKAFVNGSLSSASSIRSLLCAKSLEINTEDRVGLGTNNIKGTNKQAPIVFHSCNSADELAEKLVIRQGALKLTKYYDTEDTGYNDYFGFVGYTSNSNGKISNFDTENKAFTGYEIAKTNTDLIVKTRTVDFERNGGIGDFVSYDYLPIKTEPITVTLPECPYTAPAGKQFAGWALESATATPLKQPGDTFVLEDGGYEYDSSNYIHNDYNVYAIWEDIPEDELTGTVAINGNLKFGATLTASLTNTNKTGTLSYQWRRNGSEIAEATNNTYTLTQDDIGYTISVMVTSSEQSGSLTATATEIVAKADGPVAPTGITATACTTDENNNGTLVGITAEMEYKLSTNEIWTAGTGATITGLNNGTYLVRLKETATHNAGASANVVVNAYNAPILYGITVVDGSANVLSTEAGTTITITADEAPSGYEFDKWTGEGVIFEDKNCMTTSFVMPANNVTITATYKLITIYPDPVVEPKPENNGLSAGAIVGIVLGVVAVGGLGGLAIVWFVVRKKTFADLIATIKRK